MPNARRCEHGCWIITASNLREALTELLRHGYDPTFAFTYAEIQSMLFKPGHTMRITVSVPVDISESTGEFEVFSGSHGGH